MLHQATRRNQRAIRTGRIQLHPGDADHLPFSAAAFDRIFAINVAQFWDSPGDTCRELRRVLKPNGLVFLAVQPRNQGVSEADVDRVGEMLRGSLASAGFAGIRLERHAMHPVSTVCAIGAA
jgi:ubiquinone/menaquinone biosynthesis C-methylase UbiE